MKRALILLLVCLALVPALAAGATPAKRGGACTWGASSLVVEQVNGEYGQSEPVTTGCVPG